MTKRVKLKRRLKRIKNRKEKIISLHIIASKLFKGVVRAQGEEN